MKLSEFQNEEALDLLADIIEPATEIIADPEVQTMYKSGQPKIQLVGYILRSHKEEILDIMASMDGVPRQDYKCNVLTLPIKILEILNDEEISGFFISLASQESISSGNATESTKASAD